jgi:uncharacterized protein DUF6457
VSTKWLDEMTDRFSELTGIDHRVITPSSGQSKALLEVARVASHSSGDRINAPLLCYAIGVAVGRGANLEELCRAVETFAGPVDQRAAKR